MFVLVLGIAFLIVSFFVPRILKCVEVGNKGVKVLTTIVVIGIAIFCMVKPFITVVSPGQITKVYPLGGTERVLSVGYNFISPLDKQSTWDGTVKDFVFMERGDDSDPNDAFGGQTKNGDYMTVVANISVRIDPDRIDNYIEMFGTKNIGSELSVMLKGVCKDSFERSLEQYLTEDVMPNKSKIVANARELARGRISQQFPIVVVELTYPDIVASKEYEEAIREKARIRMQTEQFQLEQERNAAQAEANRITANGEAEVVRIAAEAQAKASLETAKGDSNAAQERSRGQAEVLRIDTEAQAGATERLAAADANAMLARATAEAEGNRLLGETYTNFPALRDFKQMDITAEIGSRWNGMYIPSIGGGDGTFNFMNLTDIATRFLDMLQPSTQVDPLP